jgi:type VI secretion system protein ImpA
MPSPEVLEFAKLLEPIAGAKPTGIDLRANRGPNSPYDKLKDARTAARAAERSLLVPMGDDDDAKKAYRDALRTIQEKWPIVRELAPQVIAEQSKDLEIAAWLIEALVRSKSGYAGLRDGFRLVRVLIERFWDNLYPLPDEDGMATRLAPLTGLNGDDSEGTLIAPIKAVAVTENQVDHVITCNTIDQAHELDSLDAERRAQRMAQGAVPMQVVDSSVSESSVDFFVNLLGDINECTDAFDTLTLLLQEKCSHEAPPSSNIRNALQSCLDTVQNISRNKLGVVVTSGGDNGTAVEGVTVVAVGSIKSREDAFRTLLQVAEYFRRNEPHTPISYALEQTVRWGKMSLPELLVELIPEESSRTNLFKWVGMKPPGTT